MSVRLSTSTLRGWSTPSLLKRAFSTTTPMAQEAGDGNGNGNGAAAPQRESSNSSLLSLNRPSRRTNGNGNGETSTTRSADAASRILSRYRQQGRADSLAMQSTQDALREQKLANDYLREMPRRWKTGDVYAPHDLSPVEMHKFRQRRARSTDIIDVLGIRPQDMYKVRCLSHAHSLNPMPTDTTGIYAIAGTSC